jgi:hypothetical protein
MVPPPPRIRLFSLPFRVTFPLLDNLTAASPRQPTQVTLARTPAHLHVLFQCADTRPWATLTRRDAPLYQEETVEVFLDPFGDLQCYFEIEVNPLNTVLDLMLRRVPSGWRKSFRWHCHGLETSASITPAGWTASLAIPFTSLAAPPTPGSVWRANFLRIDRPAAPPRELSAWSPTALNTFHDTSRFGFLEF